MSAAGPLGCRLCALREQRDPVEQPVERDDLAAKQAEELAEHPARGLRDDLAKVRAAHELVDIDPVHDRVDVDLRDDRVDVDAVDDEPVDVHVVHERVDVDAPTMALTSTFWSTWSMSMRWTISLMSSISTMRRTTCSAIA